MTYQELKRYFCKQNSKSSDEHLTAYIIFTEDSFAQKYPLLSRTYRIYSSEKAFKPRMTGYSIYADSLDGTDDGVRLERYMVEEGNSDGWKVEDCYILEQMRDATAIPSFERAEQADGTVCYFFADTCIRVRELQEDGKVRLEPISGDQTACGEWTDLPMDRVHGYCFLLEKFLKGGENS